jgi:hypothetical protein
MMRAIFALAGALAATVSFGAEPYWPQFRGPGGAGVAEDQKPPTQIGPGKNLAWRVDVPPGMSSPVVVGDRIVFTAFDEKKLFTVAHSRRDGK